MFKSRIAPIQIVIGLEPVDLDSYFFKKIDYIITDKDSQPDRFHARKDTPFEFIYLKRSVFVTNHKEKYRHLKKPIKLITDEGTIKCSYIEYLDGTFKCCPKRMFNLPDDATVYCNFGQLSDIACNFLVMSAWVTILSNVQDSVLWLVHNENDQGMDSVNVSTLLHHMSTLGGVDRQRIIISNYIDRDDHILRRVPLADIFLDLTYGASNRMSCLDAIWAGVPVVTLPSECRTSRVAASVLTKINCEYTIAKTIDDYIKIAIELGQNATHLECVRSKIWNSRMRYQLFDRKSFADELESIYKRVCEKKQNE